MYIALIKIKNESFPYELFGLDRSEFLLDITSNISFSKNVNTTRQPVLDGSVRIDNTSREPGKLSVRGMIGEHHVPGPNEGEPYIKPITSRKSRHSAPESLRLSSVTKANSFFNKNVYGIPNEAQPAQRNKPRTLVLQELLEYLRDNALILDIYAQNGRVVYKNYILTNIGVDQTMIDALEVTLSFEEVLLFSLPSKETPEGSPSGSDETITKTKVLSGIKFTEPRKSDAGSISEAIANMVWSLPKNARAIVNPPHNKSGVRSADVESKLFNKYIREPGFSGQWVASNGPFDPKLGDLGLCRAQFDNLAPIGENLQRKIRFAVEFFFEPEGQDPLYPDCKQCTTKQVHVSWALTDISDRPITLARKNMDKRRAFNSMLLKAYNGEIFRIKKAGYSAFVIDHKDRGRSAQSKGWSFLRETKNGNWARLPNLLGDDSLGYLYNASYGTHGARPFGDSQPYTYNYYYGFIWIHPLYWSYIKDIITQWVYSTNGTVKLEFPL